MSTRARDVLAHIRAVQRSLEKLREPIEVAPFLAWCAQREARIRKETDNYPAISVEMRDDARARLVAEIGWDGDTGMRLLHRWEHEIAGLVERARVEDALFSAGVDFRDVYPDEPAPRPLVVRIGQGRRMTDEQVRKAHIVYTRGRMTTVSLGEALYATLGYATPGSCGRALVDAFHSLGLPFRQCAAIKLAGGRCEGRPLHGTDYCIEHGNDRVRPSQIGGARFAARQTAEMWHPDEAFAARARALYEGGASWSQIGRALIDDTPLTSWKYLGNRVARLAREQGWYERGAVAA